MKTSRIVGFVEMAFLRVGIQVEWRGEGINEVGVDKVTEKTIVTINKKFFRPAEVEVLLGNPAKADKILGWTREIPFAELVNRMVDNDLALVEKEIKVASIQ